MTTTESKYYSTERQAFQAKVDYINSRIRETMEKAENATTIELKEIYMQDVKSLENARAELYK